MIDYTTTLGYASILDQLSKHALAELDRLFGAISDFSDREKAEALMDTMPELGDKYGAASSEVSAQFFDELNQIQEVKRPITPESFVEMPPSYWHSLVGWGTSDGFADWAKIAGGLTRRLSEMSADTMIGNAELQGGLSAQRVPRIGCCAFCSMLASRGAVYSPGSGGKVVGRGRPIGSHRLAKGIRPRGAQRTGEQYHDYCRCRVVTVTANNSVQLSKEADRHFELYEEARDKVNSGLELNVIQSRVGGSLKNEYEWIDASGEARSAKDKTNEIVKYMRNKIGA